MATLADIQAGIKTKLATIAGLNAYAVEPASPLLPAAWPLLRAGTFDNDFDGDVTYTFGITVLVNAADQGRAQTNLLPYLDKSGTKSIKAALETANTLGVSGVDSVRVLNVEAVFARDVGGGAAQIGAVLVCEVYA